MDNADQTHYEDLANVKRQRLRVLERQIERQGGDAYAQPHLLVERTELRAALAIVEPVVSTAVPASLGDDLGPAGRWLATMELERQTGKALRDLVITVAQLETRMTDFIGDTQMWRSNQRVIILCIALFLVVLLIAVSVLITLYAVR